MYQRLLIITRSRLSENNGGVNATKGFIKCLSALFSHCDILCPAYDDPRYAVPANCRLYPYLDTRSRVRKLLEVYTGRICANEPYVKSHLRSHQYDVVVIDNSFSGASLTAAVKSTGAKLITIHHNVERHYQHDNRKEYSVLFRMPYLYFAEKAEQKCLLNSDINITLTRADGQTFRSWYPDRDLHLHTWGTFEYRPIEDRHFAPRQNQQVFVITGALHFMQSLGPIMEFIEVYWPVLQSVCPSAQLMVAGRNPSQLLQDLCERHERISIVANPEDMSTIVCQADYYVCPVNVGSGLKLRVMDGLRQGLPVLCHDVSARGYEKVIDSGCMFSYHDKATFAESLRRMLAHNISRETVYQSFKDNFSFETGIRLLKRILEQEQIINRE